MKFASCFFLSVLIVLTSYKVIMHMTSMISEINVMSEMKSEESKFSCFN